MQIKKGVYRNQLVLVKDEEPKSSLFKHAILLIFPYTQVCMWQKQMEVFQTKAVTFVSLEMVGNLYHPDEVAVLHVEKHKPLRVCRRQKGSVGIDANLGKNGPNQIHQQWLFLKIEQKYYTWQNINDDIEGWSSHLHIIQSVKLETPLIYAVRGCMVRDNATKFDLLPPYFPFSYGIVW